MSHSIDQSLTEWMTHSGDEANLVVFLLESFHGKSLYSSCDYISPLKFRLPLVFAPFNFRHSMLKDFAPFNFRHPMLKDFAIFNFRHPMMKNFAPFNFHHPLLKDFVPFDIRRPMLKGFASFNFRHPLKN